MDTKLANDNERWHGEINGKMMTRKCKERGTRGWQVAARGSRK